MQAYPAAGQHLRSRRLDTSMHPLEQLTASAEHRELGSFQAAVKNLSSGGMRLAMPVARPDAISMYPGDRLEATTVLWMDDPLYEGSATVRHVSTVDADLLIGVEFDRAVNLAELHRRGLQHSFAERWKSFERDVVGETVPREFKAWVGDVRAYLEATQRLLREEDDAFKVEDEPTRSQALEERLDVAAPDVIRRLNRALDELSVLVNGLSVTQHFAHRRFLRSHLLALLLPSRILQRSNEKPLGYSGDYEMMNLLYRQPAAREDGYGALLDRWILQWGIVCAVKNRLTYLTDEIRETVKASHRKEVRIASVGCGPARELVPILEREPDIACRLDATLIDQDERAISFCERTLTPLAARTGARLHFIHQRVASLSTPPSARATQTDLVYSAGLFDYLDDPTFETLLSSLYESVAPGGLLVVGNINQTPWRWALEYLSDWFLIYRTPDQMRTQGERLDPAPSGQSVDSESTGINLFLRVRR